MLPKLLHLFIVYGERKSSYRREKVHAVTTTFTFSSFELEICTIFWNKFTVYVNYSYWSIKCLYIYNLKRNNVYIYRLDHLFCNELQKCSCLCPSDWLHIWLHPFVVLIHWSEKLEIWFSILSSQLRIILW